MHVIAAKAVAFAEALRPDHVLTDPTGTYIGHIDCWGKFLADDKVLIARSQNPAIAAAFDKIAGSFAAEGFAVHRVLLPEMYVSGGFAPATTAAYTNSLILNDYVYVPIAGAGYEDPGIRPPSTRIGRQCLITRSSAFPANPNTPRTSTRRACQGLPGMPMIW